MVATDAVVDPDSAPKIVADPSAVSGRQPFRPPTMERTQRTSGAVILPRAINSPAKMKNGTASSTCWSIVPIITCCRAVAGTSEKNRRTRIEVASSTTKKGNPNARSAIGANAITQDIDSPWSLVEYRRVGALLSLEVSQNY